jgi:hypothetical protein
MVTMGVRGEVFSEKVQVGKRTYFFNVKENRSGDLFLNVVESKKQEGAERFERHSIVVFREDLDLFLRGMDKALNFIQQEKPGRSDGGYRRDRED